MTFRGFVFRNIRGGRRRYAAFLLSCTAAVMIFYLFASFIYHPDVVGGQIVGGGGVRQGLIACEGIIAVFSFFFVLYSSSAFYKTRNKEFGLLQLFGMTPGQIRRMALLEQIIIAVAAIAAGIGLGILFSKLFFMSLAELLHTESPIRFLVVGNAVLLTAIGFFVLFGAVALFSLGGIGRRPILELLRASRKPKRPPAASMWLSILSALTLGTGYYLASMADIRLAVPLMLPITGLVVLGTYFLFTQGSVALLGRLTKRPSFYWKSTRLLTLSQLMFRLKDNARLMFSASILTAVVLTAVGSVFVLHRDFKEQVLRQQPFTISFEEKGEDAHRVVQPERLNQLLRDRDIELRAETRTVLLDTEADRSVLVSKDAGVSFIAESSWNELVAAIGIPGKLDLDPGETLFSYPFGGVSGVEAETAGERIRFRIAGETVEFVSRGTVTTNVTNHNKLLWVLDDADFGALVGRMPPSERVVLYGYDWAGWESDETLIREIEALVLSDLRTHFEERVSVYQDVQQFGSLTLFIGIFVGFLFFFAAGSLLYFKQFTELEEDRQQYRQLLRIGVSPRELSKVIRVQIGSIFFIPFAVGSVHALFAYKMLGNAMRMNLWGSAVMVLSGFFVLQLLYYWATKRTYLKQLEVI